MTTTEKNPIANSEEISTYLTSVIRGTAVSDVIVSENGKKVCIQKTPDEKERLKAAELLYKKIISEKSDEQKNQIPIILVDEFGYE